RNLEGPNRARETGQRQKMPAPVKVAIVEDQREIRECLALLVNGTDGYTCSGSYRPMEEAIEKIPRQVPDVLLSDIGLPGMSGIDGVRRLKELCPNLLVLMLTVYDDDERMYDATRASACGYLLKKTPPARLIATLQDGVDRRAPESPARARGG